MVRIISISIVVLACVSWYVLRRTTGESALATEGGVHTSDSLKQLIMTQPNFVAEEILRYSEEKLMKELDGFITSYGISKKGPTYRRDRGVVISYERPDQPAMLFYPRSREYVESPRLGVWFENADSPALLAAQDTTNLMFKRVGELEVNGHKCLKVQLSDKNDESAIVLYYIASDLRNLVIQIEVVDLLRTTTYALKNISFDVSDELFRLPSTYKISTADPTAEYRLLDNFQLSNVDSLSSESLRTAILARLRVGTPEEAVYRYLEERLVSLDRFSSYSRANKRGEIIGRIDYDPTLPGLVKKHFGFVLLLDEDHNLKDVRLNVWVSGP